MSTLNITDPSFNATALLIDPSMSQRDQALGAIILTFKEADQDVVGLGAFIGIVAAGGFTQFFALGLQRLKDCRSHALGPDGAATKNHLTYKLSRALAPSAVDDHIQFWIDIFSGLLVGLSDTQLVMGFLVLAIITATKGASQSIYNAAYLSYFTLITHAATVAVMRPYFRKFSILTSIRTFIMLAAFALWIFCEILVITFLNEITASQVPIFMLLRPSFLEIRSQYVVLFGIEVGFMSWIYFGMIPSLYLSDELFKVRKALGRWPLRRGTLDNSVVSDWALKRKDPQYNKGLKQRFCNILLLPARSFCRVYLHTRSKIGQTILWIIAELIFPWTLVNLALFGLFVGLLYDISKEEADYAKSTEWNFGQILPLAVFAFPFWGMAVMYSETRWEAVEDKKAKKVKEDDESRNSRASDNKAHHFGNNITVEPTDGDGDAEAGYRPRSPYYEEPEQRPTR